MASTGAPNTPTRIGRNTLDQIEKDWAEVDKTKPVGIGVAKVDVDLLVNEIRASWAEIANLRDGLTRIGRWADENGVIAPRTLSPGDDQC